MIYKIKYTQLCNYLEGVGGHSILNALGEKKLLTLEGTVNYLSS